VSFPFQFRVKAYNVPNRAFEELWNELSSGKPLAQVSTACAGWIARHEVWNIDETQPHKFQEHRLLLDVEEVEYQVSNFIKRLRLQTFHHKWVLPFPTSISGDLTVVVVLRTVYLVPRESEEMPGRTHISTEPINSVIIPIQLSDPDKTGKSPGPKFPGSSTPRTVLTGANSTHLGVSCSYNFRISKNNRFILFEGAKGLTVNPQAKPAITSLSVFELDLSSSIAKCSPVAQFGRIGEHQSSFNFCTFHPELPLILCHSRSFTSETGIMLWSFTSRSTQELCNQGISSEPTGFADVISTVLRSRKGMESLHFSACGTQVVVKFVGDHFPEVHSVVSDPVYQWALTQATSPGDCQSLTENHNQSGPIKKPKLELERRAASLGLGTFLVGESGASQMVFSNKKSHREVQVVRQTVDGREEIQPVLSLPNWSHLDTMRVEVHGPTSRNDKINIVLHKAAQPWYSLSDPVDENLPALVQKDPRALLHSSSRTVNMSRKRNSRGELLEKFSASGSTSHKTRLALED
jgi:hypothetical protein